SGTMNLGEIKQVGFPKALARGFGQKPNRNGYDQRNGAMHGTRLHASPFHESLCLKAPFFSTRHDADHARPARNHLGRWGKAPNEAVTP
ncbi:MAG: hypothetical protein P8I59_10960, partial [Pseudomonadales bacterium]|nr:hypothetical protein [Pseudomonadales bacterium]